MKAHVQLKDNGNDFVPMSLHQRISFGDKRESSSQTEAIQKMANTTGLPHQLKSGIEALSGHSMNDVKVHYNSSKPAQLQAHAFAQGNQIHLGPGQEKHLPHEAWHVVQQKQGRVSPTFQFKPNKVSINDDPGLEKEADTMGAKALQMKPKVQNLRFVRTTTNTVQRTITATKEQIVYSNAKWAFKSLQSTFKHIPQKDLLSILEVMDENNEKFHDFRNLKHAIEEKYKLMQGLNHFDVNKDEWAVLHRLKGGSMNHFLRAKHGEEADVGALKTAYEQTDAKYDPSKFGNSPNHNWASNQLWLQQVRQKFSKVVLTDLPLSETNVYRQTAGEEGFSAYAREIANLLYHEYFPIGKKTIPAANSWNVVAMVKEDHIPLAIRPEIKKKIKIDDDRAQEIYADETENIGRAATFTFFKNAGLPTNRTERRKRDITPSLHELAPASAIIRKLKTIIPHEFDWDMDEKTAWKDIYQANSKDLSWLGINGWTGLRRQARIHKHSIVE